MTPKEAAAALATSRTAQIVEISKDLKPHVQSQILRQFVADAQLKVRTRSIILTVVDQ